MKQYGFIFDMDGVITDSNPWHKVALRQFCEVHGIQLSDQDLLEKIYGRTNRDWITNVFGKLPEDQLNLYAEEKEKIYRQLHGQDIKPLPGIHSFLTALRDHRYPIAIGTSAPVANVDFILGRTGLTGFFPVILKDTDISNSKPHPEIYTLAANRLGLPASDCVVFEDSLSGIAAGQAAGCKVVGVATTHTPSELEHTDFVIHDFVDLNPDALVEMLFHEGE